MKRGTVGKRGVRTMRRSPAATHSDSNSSSNVSPFGGPHLAVTLSPSHTPADATQVEGMIATQVKDDVANFATACRDGDVGAVAAAMRHMERRYGAAFAVDLPDDDGVRPIEHAIHNAHVAVVEELLIAKAATVLRSGCSVLDLAIRANRPAVLERLLELHCAALAHRRVAAADDWLVVEDATTNNAHGSNEVKSGVDGATGGSEILPVAVSDQSETQLDADTGQRHPSPLSRNPPSVPRNVGLRLKASQATTPAFAGLTGWSMKFVVVCRSFVSVLCRTNVPTTVDTPPHPLIVACGSGCTIPFVCRNTNLFARCQPHKKVLFVFVETYGTMVCVVCDRVCRAQLLNVWSKVVLC